MHKNEVEVFWEEVLIPEVTKINEQAGAKLATMLLQWQEFGLNGTRQLRVSSFALHKRLIDSFVFGAMPFTGWDDSGKSLLEIWYDIENKLDTNGVYEKFKDIELSFTKTYGLLIEAKPWYNSP